MNQMTLAASTGFERRNRATRKAMFLARTEPLVPWAEFCALFEPHYPKAGNGRPPIGIERMLRMYLLANWFNLADEACGDALYDVPVFRVRLLIRELTKEVSLRFLTALVCEPRLASAIAQTLEARGANTCSLAEIYRAAKKSS